MNMDFNQLQEITMPCMNNGEGMLTIVVAK